MVGDILTCTNCEDGGEIVEISEFGRRRQRYLCNQCGTQLYNPSQAIPGFAAGSSARFAASSCAMTSASCASLATGSGHNHDMGYIQPYSGSPSREAQARDTATLLETIGELAYLDFMRRGMIWLFGDMYRYIVTLDGVIYKIKRKGILRQQKYAYKLCIVFEQERCPVEDKIIMLKLMIEGNETELITKANMVGKEPLSDLLSRYEWDDCIFGECQ